MEIYLKNCKFHDTLTEGQNLIYYTQMDVVLPNALLLICFPKCTVAGYIRLYENEYLAQL